MNRATIALWLALASTSCIAQADVLSIPVGQQQSSQMQPLPTRGTSSADVMDQFGQPAARHEPVGQPPIRRWDYPGFSVYFEQNHVVHSVPHHKPRTPTRP